MNPIAQIAAALAALAHVLFFVMESVLFSRPAVHRRFMLTSRHDVDIVQPFVFNQGFYNLALALGMGGGLIALATDSTTVGRTLILFSAGCMALAAAALLYTDRRLLRAVLVQGLPPLVIFVAAAI